MPFNCQQSKPTHQRWGCRMRKEWNIENGNHLKMDECKRTLVELWLINFNGFLISQLYVIESPTFLQIDTIRMDSWSCKLYLIINLYPITRPFFNYTFYSEMKALSFMTTTIILSEFSFIRVFFSATSLFLLVNYTFSANFFFANKIPLLRSHVFILIFTGGCINKVVFKTYCAFTVEIICILSQICNYSLSYLLKTIVF